MFRNATARAPEVQENTPEIVADLRRKLAAHAPRTLNSKPPIATGLPVIDAALQGGLPRGKLIEVLGFAGKMAFALRALAGATRLGELVAFVDAADALDAQAAQRAGVDLSRLLWVRVRSGQDGLRAVDLLLGAGGFGLVVLYLSGSPAAEAAKAGSAERARTAWPRLQQRSEHAATALLVIADRATAGSFACATLRCGEGRGVWEQVPGGRMLLAGQKTHIEVLRSRLGAPGESEPLLLRRA